MELLLLLIASALNGALFLCFYLLGIRTGEKRIREQNNDYVEVTEDNQEAIKHFLRWINYGGK